MTFITFPLTPTGAGSAGAQRLSFAKAPAIDTTGIDSQTKLLAHVGH
jgi:hypothetical protein